jgi:hypothetical protein
MNMNTRAYNSCITVICSSKIKYDAIIAVDRLVGCKHFDNVTDMNIDICKENNILTFFTLFQRPSDIS